MTLQKDSRDHLYAEIENIRVTYIPAKDRAAGKDWADSDVIRIQSYKGPNDKALHPGAEIPISSPEVFGQFVAAICQVYAQGRDQASL
jgi:hypothetical protein